MMMDGKFPVLHTCQQSAVLVLGQNDCQDLDPIIIIVTVTQSQMLILHLLVVLMIHINKLINALSDSLTVNVADSASKNQVNLSGLLSKSSLFVIGGLRALSINT